MLIDNRYKPKMLKTAKKSRKVGSQSRTLVVLGLFGAGFLFLVGRGVHMQTAGFDLLKKESTKRFVQAQTLPASRGMITDRNGTTLALSAPVDSLNVAPMRMMRMPSEKELGMLAVALGVPAQKLKEGLENGNGAFIRQYKLSDSDVKLLADTLLELPNEEQLAQLSALLKVPSEKLVAQMSNIRRDFIYLKRHLSKDTVEKINALGIKGLSYTKESKRHYPMGNLFSQIVGFTDIDGKGQEGLELSQNRYLSGTDGKKVVLRDRKGNVVDSLETKGNQEPEDGKNLVLSLDQRIQTLAYDALMKAMNHHSAKVGSAVVLDAQTGEILALVNSPSFDPNNPSATKPENRKNRAISDMFEPGSVMKPLTIVKAMDDRKVGLNTWFNTASYKIGSHTIRDTHDYPSLNVRGIIQKSSNTGTSRISAMYSPEEMYNFYSSIGVNERVKIGFPYEAAGTLHSWKSWKPIEQATMSYGYGLQMSLLQLARAYTILGTDGKLMPVSIKKRETIPEGRQVIRPETARMMREMMVSVTEKGGTGRQGAVSGFDVAAKTGTTRKLVKSQYSGNRHMATFIGLAPAQKPRLIVAVNIDEPTRNGFYGGPVAGPVFSKIMSGSLNILGVAPTKTLKEELSEE
ncbi:MAG: penicillin-binding protein 2 [Neisseria sp.]|nr:penicillin-binding protein 2 [Neisseria sp.]